jgi:hypothetical protein
MERKKALEGLHYVCISDYLLLSHNEKVHDNSSSPSTYLNDRYHCLYFMFSEPPLFCSMTHLPTS